MKWMPIAASLLALRLLLDPAAVGIGTVGLVSREEAAAGETEIPQEDITPKRGRKTPGRKPRRSLRSEEGTEAERTGAVLSCAAGTGAYSWYAVHEKNGKRPAQPAEVPPVGEYGGYYLGKDEPVVYLTFDAGYENGNVAKILDGLKAEGVTGAFFILENLTKRDPDLVRRMKEEGHLVCNHTARHRDMSAMTEAEFKKELGRMEAAYREATGEELSKYYRPPEGRFTVENLTWAKEMGYSTVFWSYAYADWDNDKQPDPDKALAQILSGVHHGMVLLLHPTSATNAQILPALIRSLKDMGYRFGTLDELTGGGGLAA